MPHPLVVHSKRQPYDVYIGRKSRSAPKETTGEWGNPFAMKNQTYAERKRVIQEYERWLLAQPALVQRARQELRGRVLGCYCAPKACHGDVLARVANSDAAEETPGTRFPPTVSSCMTTPVTKVSSPVKTFASTEPKGGGKSWAAIAKGRAKI